MDIDKIFSLVGVGIEAGSKLITAAITLAQARDEAGAVAAFLAACDSTLTTAATDLAEIAAAIDRMKAEADAIRAKHAADEAG